MTVAIATKATALLVGRVVAASGAKPRSDAAMKRLAVNMLELFLDYPELAERAIKNCRPRRIAA